MTPLEANFAKDSDRAPSEKPPFTLGALRKAVPPHCFNRSVIRSASYLILDVSILAAMVYCTTWFEEVQGIGRWILWCAYWIGAGCVATGVWVIAHECGHHAFSDYEWLDDTVGLVFHSCLLVPYFSWKYSHRRHHSNTANVERDEVFVPKQKEGLRPIQALLQTPPGRVLQILITLTLGWPLYLSLNVSGRKYPRFACHFDPKAPIFSDRETRFIFISDIALFVAAYGLHALGSHLGYLWLLKIYGVPLLIVNGFLVLITLLQHTHPSLPHYTEEEWDWLRGALSTVDRDYGLLNHVFHHITDTHVTHHVFSTMPHYHAQEATKVLKPLLGKYYQFDGTPVWKALWRETRECVYVEADPKDKGVLWYSKQL